MSGQLIDDTSPATPASGGTLSDATVNPAEGMTGMQKYLAGLGGGAQDLALGTGQLMLKGAPMMVSMSTGLPLGLLQPLWAGQQKEAAQAAFEKRAIDEPLKATPEGTAGNLTAQLLGGIGLGGALGGGAMAAAGAGAAQGAIQPSINDSEMMHSALLGGALGMGGQLAGNFLKYVFKGATPASDAVQAAMQVASDNGGQLSRGQITQSQFMQRLERMLRSLPGSGKWYEAADAANARAFAEGIGSQTAGGPETLGPQLAGMTFNRTSPELVAEAGQVGSNVPGFLPSAKPTAAINMAQEITGTGAPQGVVIGGKSFSAQDIASNPLLQRLAQGGQPSSPTTIPMTGPKNDLGNYMGMRSTVAGNAWDAGVSGADRGAWLALRNALDNQAMRDVEAQGADPAILAQARYANQIKELLQPAEIRDTAGEVSYNPSGASRLINRAFQTGQIKNLPQAMQTQLWNLSKFAEVSKPVTSSGTAEGNIAGKVATLDILKDLVTGGGGSIADLAMHVLGPLGALWGAPRVVNAALQATRSGVPVLGAAVPSSVLNNAGAIAASYGMGGFPSLGQMMGGGQ